MLVGRAEMAVHNLLMGDTGALTRGSSAAGAASKSFFSAVMSFYMWSELPQIFIV
jgi:hypothetical protein